MSRKHYEIIARTIGESRDSFRSNTAHAIYARRMARELATTNPRFDVSRFVLACMPRAWVGSSKANVWERLALSA